MRYFLYRIKECNCSSDPKIDGACIPVSACQSQPNKICIWPSEIQKDRAKIEIMDNPQYNNLSTIQLNNLCSKFPKAIKFILLLEASQHQFWDKNLTLRFQTSQANPIGWGKASKGAYFDIQAVYNNTTHLFEFFPCENQNKFFLNLITTCGSLIKKNPKIELKQALIEVQQKHQIIFFGFSISLLVHFQKVKRSIGGSSETIYVLPKCNSALLQQIPIYISLAMQPMQPKQTEPPKQLETQNEAKQQESVNIIAALDEYINNKATNEQKIEINEILQNTLNKIRSILNVNTLHANRSNSILNPVDNLEDDLEPIEEYDDEDFESMDNKGKGDEEYDDDK